MQAGEGQVTRRGLVVTAASAARVAGANERVNVGLVGCGGRGRYVARLMAEAGARIVAVADVYGKNAEAARAWAGEGCRAFGDFRRLLEMGEVDAVVVATPDHWHAAVAVLACRAGKHVYVEKPLSHNVREGRAIVEAAARHGRIVQPGMQHRSSGHFGECAELVRSGALGKVSFVRVWNWVNMVPKGIGRAADEAAPEGLDWDMYCGPAPLVAYNRKRFLTTYRWFWDYSGGYVTDFGTHRFDTVHQVMGVSAPRSVTAMGGRFAVDDAGEMPDVLSATFEYDGFVMVYEGINMNGYGAGVRTAGMRYYNARGPYDRPNGMAFYGSNGTLMADRVGYEVFPELASGAWPPEAGATGMRMERRQVSAADATGAHARAFVEAVRGLRGVAATIEDGHRSTTVPHLANISYRTGMRLRWDGVKEDFVGAPAASVLLGRKARKAWDLF